MTSQNDDLIPFGGLTLYTDLTVPAPQSMFTRVLIISLHCFTVLACALLMCPLSLPNASSANRPYCLIRMLLTFNGFRPLQVFLLGAPATQCYCEKLPSAFSVCRLVSQSTFNILNVGKTLALRSGCSQIQSVASSSPGRPAGLCSSTDDLFYVTP